MRWRLYPMNNDSTWTPGTVFRETLPADGLLSTLLLELSCVPITDSMNATEQWRPLDWITELKIQTGGGRPLKQLSGRVLRALACADGWPEIIDQDFNYGSSRQRWHIPINFGRYPADPITGLPLEAFKSIQCLFTNNASASYYTGDWTLNLHLLLLEDSPDPRPFSHRIETAEYQTYTTVQNAYKPLDYPEEGLLRRVIWQIDPDMDAAENAEATIYGTIDKIKLTLKTGDKEHVNHSPRDLWMYQYLMGMRSHLVGGEPYHTSLQGIRTGLGQTIYKAGMAMPQGMVSATPTIALEAGNDSSTQKILRTGTDNMSMLWAGHALENCTILPFSRWDDLQWYLNLATEKTVKQELHVANAAAAADATVVTLLETAQPNEY